MIICAFSPLIQLFLLVENKTQNTVFQIINLISNIFANSNFYIMLSKNKIIAFSLLLLAQLNFSSCEKSNLSEEQELITEDNQSTDKGDVGTIGNSEGSDDDDDYN